MFSKPPKELEFKKLSMGVPYKLLGFIQYPSAGMTKQAYDLVAFMVYPKHLVKH